MSCLKIDGITYELDGQTLIKNVSFSIDKGEFVTIIGSSGSGKSTLLKIIASLLTPSKGEIYLDGIPQSKFVPNDYRKEVSYCFQQPVLFGETVKDNLIFPSIIRKQPFDSIRGKNLLQQVALEPVFLDKKITSLSGGEKQRIALISNLMYLPQVLLLDEVTVGLDTENKEIIHRLIGHLKQQGLTILQITHDSTEIETAERILTMEGGEIHG